MNIIYSDYLILNICIYMVIRVVSIVTWAVIIFFNSNVIAMYTIFYRSMDYWPVYHIFILWTSVTVINRYKMAAIFQTFSNAIFRMQMFEFRLQFNWNLFSRNAMECNYLFML